MCIVSGEFLASRGRHKEAAARYEKAAELNPENYGLVVAAATAMRQAARLYDAERWYRRALQIKPEVCIVKLPIFTFSADI